jgi:hypothetical protein
MLFQFIQIVFTSPCPTLKQWFMFTSHTHNIVQIYFSIIPQSNLRSLNFSFSFSISVFLTSPVYHFFSVPLIHLEFVPFNIIILKGTKCDAFLAQFSRDTCYFALLNLNILLSILFSNNIYCGLETAYPDVCHCFTQFLWADVDIALQVRMRQLSYASVPVNYLTVLLKLDAT